MKIINIEGIDGTGKTGLLHDLKKELGVDNSCYISFPTGWFYTEYTLLKKQVMDKHDFEVEVNKLQTEDKIRTYNYQKDLGKEYMFCDRFDLSQKVYNGSSLGVDTLDTGIESDLVIYLDADVEIVMERIKLRGVEDPLGYEKESKLRDLKNRYETILDKEYKDRYIRFRITKDTTKEGLKQDVIKKLKEFGV